MKTKVIMLREIGGPDRLVIEDVDVGEPGPDQVLLKQTAIGVNFAETQVRRGFRPMPLPGIPGGEAAGVVEAVGSDVDTVEPGDRVAYCGTSGAYAERRLIPAGALLTVPDNISDEVAAASLAKGITAWYLIRRTVPIKAGDQILYHAAAGGVGTILCQWAKHLGAHVIGTVSSEDKKQRALRNGCDAVINYTEEDFVDRVMDLTNGEGVRVCYDSVALDTFDQSMRTIAPFGHIVLFGNASGDVDPESYTRIPLDRYFIHPTLPRYLANTQERDGAVRELFEVIGKGVVKIDIPQKYPLEEAALAQDNLESRRTVGSSILLP